MNELVAWVGFLFVIEFNQLIEWVMSSCSFSFNDEIEFNVRNELYDLMNDSQRMFWIKFILMNWMKNKANGMNQMAAARHESFVWWWKNQTIDEVGYAAGRILFFHHL